ncbi:MAG: membrane protein insertase YidC [Propionibacteriaceae bacterium]|jgi:YidC/Oxa1 family membrane protein insertase|nr:membrane protein insertase YidC [Propionibacteriaceae bacterium]
MTLIPLIGIADIGNTIMTPFYWLVSGMMVLFQKAVAPILGADRGVTWLLVIVMIIVVLRSALLPLYIRSIKSMRATSALQPQMAEIREKYKNDRDKQSRETMKLYEEAGVSPYASCLPMIGQMPVFMGLFWVINGAARAVWDPELINEATGALGAWATPPKGTWLVDRPELVDSIQNSDVFGVSVSSTFLPLNSFGVTQVFIMILFVIMSSVMIWQQWYTMNRNMQPSVLEGPMGKQQKIMMYLFPLMYLIGGGAIPMGVMFYWCCSNVWTAVQQWFMVRAYPTPGTPAYIDWEDRMIAAGKDPRQIEEERREQNRKNNSKSITAKMAAQAREAEAREFSAQATEGEGARAKVSSIVEREDSSGKKVIVRSQPKVQSRAKRKK